MTHPAFCSPLFQHSRELWGFFFWSTLWMEASTRVRVQGPSWMGRAGAPAARGACKVSAHGRWGSRSCQRAGRGCRRGSLLLPRDVIHFTFVRSNFRSSSIALALQRQAVPEFIIDMLLDSNVASSFGDDGGPRCWPGGAPWPLYKAGVPRDCSSRAAGGLAPRPSRAWPCSIDPSACSGRGHASALGWTMGLQVTFSSGLALPSHPLPLVWVGHSLPPPLHWPPAWATIRDSLPPTYLQWTTCASLSGEGAPPGC